MAYKQKLIADIRSHFKQCKWEDTLHEHIVQILEMRPAQPYEYIQKKISLRSKLDNTKHSSFLSQLLIYCLYINPLKTTKTEVQNKILYLCVDKYQHTKIRRNEAMNIINGLFLLANSQQKQKEYFTKIINQQLESQTVYITYFAYMLYCTILYMAMKKQIDELDEKLSQVNQHINMQILNDYLQSVNEENSMQQIFKDQVKENENQIIRRRRYIQNYFGCCSCRPRRLNNFKKSQGR